MRLKAADLIRRGYTLEQAAKMLNVTGARLRRDIKRGMVRRAKNKG